MQKTIIFVRYIEVHNISKKETDIARYSKHHLCGAHQGLCVRYSKVGLAGERHSRSDSRYGGESVRGALTEPVMSVWDRRGTCTKPAAVVSALRAACNGL